MKKVVSIFIIALLLISIAPALIIADDDEDNKVCCNYLGPADESLYEWRSPEKCQGAEDVINPDTIVDEDFCENVDDESETEDEEELEEESIDDDTEEETEIMDNTIGAQIRVLQLQRNLQLKLLQMETVIIVLNNKSVNTSSLTEIKEELKLLIEESKTIPTTNTKEAVKKFVDIKRDAKDLVKDFKEIASNLLTNEDKVSLKETFKELDKTELQELKNQIRDLNNGLNVERLRKIMQHMGIENEELIQQVKAGEITAKQAFEQLKEQYKSLSDEGKKQVREKLKQEKIQRRINKIDKITNVKVNIFNRISERIRERADILEKKGFLNISIKLDTKADWFQEKAETVREKAETLKNKVQDKIKVRGE